MGVRRETGGRRLFGPLVPLTGAVRMQRGNEIKKHRHVPANNPLSCPLPCALRSLHSDWSRCPHDAGGFPGLLWGCAGVPVHAGIGECPLCAHPRSHSPGGGMGQSGWPQDDTLASLPFWSLCLITSLRQLNARTLFFPLSRTTFAFFP